MAFAPKRPITVPSGRRGLSRSPMGRRWSISDRPLLSVPEGQPFLAPDFNPGWKPGHHGHGRIQSGRARRSQSPSIIEPVRIEGDAVTAEEENELVSRAPIPVMDLLVLDIPSCPLTARFADGEDSIAALPEGFARGFPELLQPMGGTALHLLNDGGQRESWPAFEQEVDMVLHATDLHSFSSLLLDEAAEL